VRDADAGPQMRGGLLAVSADLIISYIYTDARHRGRLGHAQDALSLAILWMCRL